MKRRKTETTELALEVSMQAQAAYLTAVKDLENKPPAHPAALSTTTNKPIRIFTDIDQIRRYKGDGVLLIDELPNAWFMKNKQDWLRTEALGIVVMNGNLMWLASQPLRLQRVVESARINQCHWAWAISPAIVPVYRAMMYLEQPDMTTLGVENMQNSIIVWGKTHDEAVNGVAGHLIVSGMK